MRALQGESIDIYIVRNDTPREEKLLAPILLQLPEQDIKRAERFRRRSDRQALLLGRYLLMEYCRHNSLALSLEQELCSAPLHKPFLLHKAFKFNISHCSSWVVCGFHPTLELGIDIESIDDVKISDYELILCEEELKALERSPTPVQLFYQIWTKKEAVCKLIGVGLSARLKEIDCTKARICYEHQEYQHQLIEIDDNHVCHLALPASVQSNRLNIVEITL